MPIYLIRHGQSEFNAAHTAGAPDPMIFDAPLTARGIAQAQSARATLGRLGIRHVIASPLTRAIETAQLLFGPQLGVTINAAPRERLDHSCDIGRRPAALAADFPDLAFDHLDDIWWHQGPLNENGVPVEPDNLFKTRIARFTETLPQYTTRPLAIVAHGNTIKAITGVQLDNCEYIEFTGPSGAL